MTLYETTHMREEPQMSWDFANVSFKYEKYVILSTSWTDISQPT